MGNLTTRDGSRSAAVPSKSSPKAPALLRDRHRPPQFDAQRVELFLCSFFPLPDVVVAIEEGILLGEHEARTAAGWL